MPKRNYGYSDNRFSETGELERCREQRTENGLPTARIDDELIYRSHGGERDTSRDPDIEDDSDD